MTTVSIIIPCYNAETTIAETVESALSQSPLCQVIVVDDGSRDRSAEILRGFGSRIQAIFGPNRGVSAARNLGVEAATGEWVQFLDSDDLLTAGTVERRLSAGGDLVICDWQEFSANDGQITDGALRSIDTAALDADPEGAVASHVWAPPAAVLYRRSLVDRIGGFRLDLPVIQDARFLFDAVRLGASVVRSPHAGARYRVLAGSLSRRNPQAFYGDILTNGLQIEALWRSDGELAPSRRVILGNIFNHAARGLFSCGDPRYFEAVKAQHSLGIVSRHARLATLLARVVGLPAARSLLALGQRA